MLNLSSHAKRKMLAGLACVGIVVLAGVLLRDVAPPADRWITDHLYFPAAGSAFAAISGAGTLVCAGMLVASFGWLWRRHGFPVVLRGGAVLACCLATALLQVVFQRVGPPQHEPDWTYPSGHVVVITALVATAVVAAASVSATWARLTAAIGAVAILAVSASRVVVAQHWLVDVAGAALATAGVALVAATVLRLPTRLKYAAGTVEVSR